MQTETILVRSWRATAEERARGSVPLCLLGVSAGAGFGVGCALWLVIAAHSNAAAPSSLRCACFAAVLFGAAAAAVFRLWPYRVAAYLEHGWTSPRFGYVCDHFPKLNVTLQTPTTRDGEALPDLVELMQQHGWLPPEAP